MNQENVLRYGEFLVDKKYITADNHRRIRLIEYDGILYYHEMLNGEVIEFKKVGKAEAR